MKIGLIIIVLLIGAVIYFWQTIIDNPIIKMLTQIPYYIAIIAAILVMIYPRNYDEIPGMISDYWYN